MIIGEFKKQFKFPYKDFSKPIEWTDGVGFSLVKKTLNNHASLYKFGINEQELEKENSLKSLWISVGYGEETSNGITFLSRKKSLWDPINLDYRDEYFYDVKTHKFYRYKEEISTQNILSRIEEAHMRPTKRIKGFPLRSRLWYWRKVLPFIIKYIDILLIKSLWLISGEKIKDDIWERILGISSERVDEQISSKEVYFDESKTMDFFGYKAKRWSVVFYCIVHLIIYVVLFYLHIEYKILTKMITSNFLVVSYIIVSFSITESLIPKALKSIINKITPKIFNDIASKKLEV